MCQRHVGLRFFLILNNFNFIAAYLLTPEKMPRLNFGKLPQMQTHWKIKHGRAPVGARCRLSVNLKSRIPSSDRYLMRTKLKSVNFATFDGWKDADIDV